MHWVDRAMKQFWIVRAQERIAAGESRHQVLRDVTKSLARSQQCSYEEAEYMLNEAISGA